MKQFLSICSIAIRMINHMKQVMHQRE